MSMSHKDCDLTPDPCKRDSTQIKNLTRVSCCIPQNILHKVEEGVTDKIFEMDLFVEVIDQSCRSYEDIWCKVQMPISRKRKLNLKERFNNLTGVCTEIVILGLLVFC